MFHCSRKRLVGNSWHLPRPSSHRNMFIAKTPAPMVWSSQLPCGGWGELDVSHSNKGQEWGRQQQQSPVCRNVVLHCRVCAIGGWGGQVCFCHWLTKSVAVVWKWQVKNVQSGDRYKAAWKGTEFNSLGIALPVPGDLQGFASTAAPVAIGREMHAELYSDSYTHHLRCLTRNYN